MRFENRIVWITGASSGIGEALARAFAAEGAVLVLSSRRVEELERVRQSCAHPERHRVLPLDLARPDTFPEAAATVERGCGRIDILVNNAGIGQRALAAESSLAAERAVMEVDYFGPVALTKAVLPAMRARQSGHLVVVSSVMGYVATPGRSTYAAAKHALHGYFDTLRAETWREGIKVTIACPGYVKTAISEHALNASGGKHGRIDQGQLRGISAERCAAAIVRAVARNREEIAVGGPEVLAVWLKRFAPWLFSRIVRRIKFTP